MKTKIILLLLLLLIQCGETAMLKEPFRISFAKYENRADSPILHSGGDDRCSILMHKRFYNILFVLPLNGYSSEELAALRKGKSLRYKNVMLTGDILFTALGFLASWITYSVEIEECATSFTAISSAELDRMKSALEGNSNEKELIELRALLRAKEEELSRVLKEKELALRVAENTTIVKTVTETDPNLIEIPDIPILTAYTQYIRHNQDSSKQEYIVSFENKKFELRSVDKKKIKKFAENYRKNFKSYKILLIGHTDWKGDEKSNIALSLERVKAVKEELQDQGVDKDSIYTTASGAYWPGNNEEKSSREFSRRVDMLFIE